MKIELNHEEALRVLSVLNAQLECILDDNPDSLYALKQGERAEEVCRTIIRESGVGFVVDDPLGGAISKIAESVYGAKA